jgi:hypothetical protein
MNTSTTTTIRFAFDHITLARRIALHVSMLAAAHYLRALGYPLAAALQALVWTTY